MAEDVVPQPQEAPPSPWPYTWAKRRRFMYAVSIFCAFVIGYVLWNDMQSSVANTAVAFSFIILGTNVGSYVFGAAWQDVNHMKIGGR